jgi:hypothetical protein
MVRWFGGRLEELASQSVEDPAELISVLMDEALERAKASRYYSVASGRESDSTDDSTRQTSAGNLHDGHLARRAEKGRGSSRWHGLHRLIRRVIPFERLWVRRN